MKIEELLKEVKKRFGEDWENAEIEEDGYPFDNVINESNRLPCITSVWIFTENGMVYQDGTWAEPKKPYKIGDFGYFWDGYKSAGKFGFLEEVNNGIEYPFYSNVSSWKNFQPIKNKEHIKIIKSYMK